MTITFTLRSASHSLPTKYGFHGQFPVPSERRRISNLKYCLFEKNNNIRSSTTSNSENKYEATTKRISSEKHHELIVPRCSKDQQLDLNISPNAELINERFTAFYSYFRPYTMIATVISVPLISILPLRSLAEVSPAFLVGVLKAIVIFLACNTYVVGLNQICDLEIDKVNKPNRPIASGALSVESGVALVSMSLLVCLAMGIAFGSPPLCIGALIYCLFGSLYSFELPFMRWKKNQFLAIMCLVMARAIAIPFGTFLHIQKYVLGRPIFLTRSVIFASCFAALFCVVIGLSKDLPDIEGDRLYGMNLLTVSLGQHRVFLICISILMLIYGGAIGVGTSSTFMLSKLVIILGHSALACLALYRALTTDPSIEESSSHFYIFVWRLACAEYFLIPFVR